MRRPALVKVQGPFTDVQLNSVARGIVYLQRLGLISVVVVERDDIAIDVDGKPLCASEARRLAAREMERTVSFLVQNGASARPMVSTFVRSRTEQYVDSEGRPQNQQVVYVEDEGIGHIQGAIEDADIPVFLPIAMDEDCKTVNVDGNQVVGALCQAMTAGNKVRGESGGKMSRLDITPQRILIINREGGIPSYARSGMPHLSINLVSEYDFIQDTFLEQWTYSHPTALSSLTLSRDCLKHLPSGASALIASHKSPAALIANLITNKPAHSASLPHSLLAEGEGKITPHTPTLIRKGVPIRVVRSMAEIDEQKMTRLMEKSFGRIVHPSYWQRLQSRLDFAIIAGDYAGAAICTREGSGTAGDAWTYLDKFAVLPSHQGDGTVDFLWVALRDETFGLGLRDAANANEGSLAGVGSGRDLVWRSRADNPVNKWYYERSNGFVTIGNWKMFWCDAEQRIRSLGGPQPARRNKGIVVAVVDRSEKGRVEEWGSTIGRIPSAWK